LKTILLVDDDQQVRTMLGLALRKNGYHVLEADSGAAGLAMARRHLPDVILSDIHMPGGDGSTLLRDIRHDSELRSRQVVLMTGRPDLVTPRNGMEEGADDFLVKPVELKALVSCMDARFNRASINWRVEDQTLARLRSSIPSQLPHEFFTPLAGIIGLMDVLRSDFPSLAPAEIEDIHNDIYLSALRLNRTLRNYLLILDLQNGPAAPASSALSCSEVEQSVQAGLDEALRLHQRREDVTVRVEACSLSVKAGDLSRIVEELVHNAFKFSRLGTPVTIELSANGQLTVADSGRGMTAEEVSRIGAFQQFDRKKNEQQGLGLGLVLVQKLTALCGAKFSPTSQPGEGTQARVTFATAAS
jgi:two-component system sensor histidine kinase/response regulator